MLTFDDSYFLGETREGFYIEPMMKCVWAAQLEVMCVIQQICEKYNIPYFAYYGTYWEPYVIKGLYLGTMIPIFVCYVKTINAF